MKAAICDFCGRVISEKDTEANLYEIIICCAEGYDEPQSESFKSLLLDAEHTCHECTTLAHEALMTLKKKLAAK